jgi:hypothetical protein
VVGGWWVLKTGLLSAVVVLLSAAAVAAQEPLLPVDEASRRPGFFSFRAQLQRAIAGHDTTALLAIVHPQIKNSFGGNDGIDEFRTMWNIGAADSRIWEVLGTLLALGGSFQGDSTFVAPYVFSRWPETLDAFEHIAVIGTDVRVRSQPNTAAPVITVASFAILPVDRRAEETEQWIAVRVDGGRSGYIASRFARSPIDYRAIFREEGGQWKLVTLVAGD